MLDILERVCICKVCWFFSYCLSFFMNNVEGIYFSKHPDYTFCYGVAGAGVAFWKPGQTGTIIVFEVVLGKQKKLEKKSMGGGQEPGFDCHISPLGMEVVIFHGAACLPKYLLSFSSLAAKASALNGQMWE